jgi:hypothetical protein
MMLIAALSVLAAVGANAASIRLRNDPQLTSFRTYKAPGCPTSPLSDNEGVSTITQSQLPSDGSGCLVFSKLFDDPNEPVFSLMVGDLNSGCTCE